MIIRDKKYTTWLRTQRCVATGQYSNEYDAVEAAHIGTAGKGIKSSDDECLPMIHSEHMESHRGDASYWLRIFETDPHLMRLCLRAYARELYKEYLQNGDN